MAKTQTPDYYREQLRENGFVTVEFGLSQADIGGVVDEFAEVSDLVWPADDPKGVSRELYDALHYRIPERPDDADYFLVRRRIGEVNEFNPRGEATENKDLAHIGPLSLVIAEQKLGKRMPAAVRQFLIHALEIHAAAKTAVRPVYEALGITDWMLAEKSDDDIHMVRVLRYLGTTASHQADLHFDRAVATLATWESLPGLVGAPAQNDYLRPMTVVEYDAMCETANTSPITHRDGEAKFFLAAGYNHLPLQRREVNGELPLLAHGVVNEANGQERNAVVVFMNPHRGIPIGDQPGQYCAPAKHETGFDQLRDKLLAQEQAA